VPVHWCEDNPDYVDGGRYCFNWVGETCGDAISSGTMEPNFDIDKLLLNCPKACTDGFPSCLPPPPWPSSAATAPPPPSHLHGVVGSAVKFVFTAVGQAGQDLHLQEVELFGPSGQLAVLSATNPGGAAANGQVASRAIDGNKVDKWSKWFDDNMDTRGNSTLVLELGAAQLVTSYDLWTARDKPHKRDPITWKVYSLEATTNEWRLVDSRADVLPPSDRFASYGGFTIPPPPPVPPSPPSPSPSPSPPPSPAPPPHSCSDIYVSDSMHWLVNSAGHTYTGNQALGCDYFDASPARCSAERWPEIDPAQVCSP